MDHDGPLCILPQVSSKMHSRSWHIIWHQIDISNISILWHIEYLKDLIFYSYIILSSFHAHVGFWMSWKPVLQFLFPLKFVFFAPQLVNLKKNGKQRLGSLINHESLEVRCFGVHYYLPPINHGSMKKWVYLQIWSLPFLKNPAIFHWTMIVGERVVESWWDVDEVFFPAWGFWCIPEASWTWCCWWFRNVANQLRLVDSSHHLPGFIHPRWLFGTSEPSTVSNKNTRWRVRFSKQHIRILFWGGMFFFGLPSVKLTFSPLKIGRAPKGNDGPSNHPFSGAMLVGKVPPFRKAANSAVAFLGPCFVSLA